MSAQFVPTPVRASMFKQESIVVAIEDFDIEIVAGIKALPGARFYKATKTKSASWRLPLNMDSATGLRQVCGNRLVLDAALKQWGHQAVADSRQLAAITGGTAPPLVFVPQHYPALYKALYVGPVGLQMTQKQRDKAFAAGKPSFQLVDAGFLAHVKNSANLSDMGTGKTLVSLASIVESQLPGPHLVVAPLSSLVTVWQKEIEAWLPDYKTVVVSGTTDQKAVALAALKGKRLNKTIVITNPATVQLTAVYQVEKDKLTGKKKKIEVDTFWKLPKLPTIKFGVMVLDEFHMMGLTNEATLTSRALRKIQCVKKLATSGTPMGGKPLKLFGLLSFLAPAAFPSKWRFVDDWLDSHIDEYGYRVIGDIKQAKMDEFTGMLGQYVRRHTKAEVLPWLPPKHRVYRTIAMLPKQAAMYQQFAEEAEIRIEELELTATSILAEYTRLKQFANAQCDLVTVSKFDPDQQLTVDVVKPLPLMHKSAKMDYVLGLIETLDIPNSEEQLVIFSQFVDVVNGVAEILVAKGIPTEKITGEVKQTDRIAAQTKFQQGKFKVMCVNTYAGGVAITLDKASTVVFFDETWSPDDQLQAEDRCHRASRLHQVTVHYLRSENTVEDWIRKVNTNKALVNYTVLDARRDGYRAKG